MPSPFDTFFRLRQFNAADWYWFVGDDKIRVYSSARGRFVLATDAAYLGWAVEPPGATRIESVAQLNEVLRLRGLPLAPTA